MSNLYAVIMAGGAGTRFWPASRANLPKQLLPLAGSGEALLAATVRRILPLCPEERIFIATGAHLVDACRDALPGIPAENFLAEPLPRNTAPCIGWAAATILRRDPEAKIMVLPSDHHIADEAGFRSVLQRANEAADAHAIVTVGISPTRPETGYGYIEQGEEVREGVFRMARFIEKPNRELAEVYANSGTHLWNAGMFFFRASSMLDEIRKHLPDLAARLDDLDEAAEIGDEASLLEDAFSRMPSISIDHGVMERAADLAVVPGSFGWSDVGSWHSAWELADKDERGNASPEGTVLIEASGNMVANWQTTATKKTIALAYVSDLVVVETDDALLVLPREKAQDVRAVIEALKARGKGELL